MAEPGEPRIEKVYIWIGVRPDGTEGMLGFRAADGSWMPLVTSRRELADSSRAMAQRIAATDGLTARLVTFERAGDEP